MTVIFFDIGDTLATPRLDAQGRLIEFIVLPGALPALRALSERSIRMGIISNRGNIPADTVTRALETSGLLSFFDPTLIIFERKDSPAPFTRAAFQAGVPPGECFFVGENNEERAHALNAGFQKAIPDPALVLDVLDGAALLFASLSHAETESDLWSKAFSELAVVPLRVANNPRSVQVVTTTLAIAPLHHAGFMVEYLGKEDDPQLADLYLVRDDRPVPEEFSSGAEFSNDFLANEGWSDLVVGKTDGSLLVALPAGVSIEQLHFPDALHGHNERLVPDTSLLRTLTTATTTFEAPTFDVDFALTFGNEELEALRGITPERVQRLHERYIGVAPLTVLGTPVVSRHIRHADNTRVTNALVDHFGEEGGAEIVVRRHPFKYQQLRLENIEAEFAGEDPDSFVLITAHLDSTAISSAGGFNAETDPAPGSDDDASGVAAVLAAARVVAQIRPFKKIKRSIRFVLFNAEEQGLVGSKEYARAQAAQTANIAGVFQMDMIGFRRQEAQPARNFEIHAGFGVAPDVERRSLTLAQLVQQVVPQVSPSLNAPQIYPDAPGGPDPAAGRSDHSAFQERGYAACVMCEDFFAGPKPDSPPAQRNLDYHKDTDKQIDYEYAADIARAVAAAALIVADA
jgi:hypothetical protein